MPCAKPSPPDTDNGMLSTGHGISSGADTESDNNCALKYLVPHRCINAKQLETCDNIMLLKQLTMNARTGTKQCAYWQFFSHFF